MSPAGIAAAERSVVPQTRVVEVAGKEPRMRVFVVHSEERVQWERSMRETAMARVAKSCKPYKRRWKKAS